MSRKWCRDTTPIVRIDTRRVDISFESYEEIQVSVTGPTKVEVRLPVGSTFAVLDVSQSFGNLGYEWTFIHDTTCDVDVHGPKIKVRAWVPANPDPIDGGAFPIKMTCDPLDSNNGSATVSGSSNAWTGTASVRV